MAQFGSACDDVGVFGESPDEEDESDSDLKTRLEVMSVWSDERRVEEEATPRRTGQYMMQRPHSYIDQALLRSMIIQMTTYSSTP
jgi:hypothetical protein